MKMLQKYTSIALLLLSAATIVPAYANSEDDYVEFKERMIQQSKNPEMLKMAFKAGETIYLAAGITALTIWATGLVMLCINPGAVRGPWIPIIKYEYLQEKLAQLKNHISLNK